MTGSHISTVCTLRSVATALAGLPVVWKESVMLARGWSPEQVVSGLESKD